jgi:membrane-associated phospholipid phosphatase
MRRPRRSLLVWLLVGTTVLPILPAAAQETPPSPAPDDTASDDTPLTLPEAGHLLVLETQRILLAPAYWSARGWGRFGLVVAGVGAVALADKSIRDRELRDHSKTADDIARLAEPLGSSDGLFLLGGFYLGGLLGHDGRAERVGFDGAVACLLAGGVVAPVWKEIAGRSRPRETTETFDFHPLSGRASFPSGHATQAFAIASTIATSYQRPWIEAASYGVATLVGFARVHHKAHFASDVAAGAAIGTAVGHTVVLVNRRDHRERAHAVALGPVVGPRGQPGLGLDASF